MTPESVTEPKVDPNAEVKAMLAAMSERLAAAEARAAAAEARAAEDPPAAHADLTQMAQGVWQLAQSVKDSADHGPIRQIPFHKALIKTPFNPTGVHLGRVTLKRNSFWNGYPMRESMLRNEGIEAANALVPGTYTINGVKIHVTESDNQIGVRYSNKDRDAVQRLARFEHAEAILQEMVKQGPDPVAAGPRVAVGA